MLASTGWSPKSSVIVGIESRPELGTLALWTEKDKAKIVRVSRDAIFQLPLHALFTLVYQ